MANRSLGQCMRRRIAARNRALSHSRPLVVQISMWISTGMSRNGTDSLQDRPHMPIMAGYLSRQVRVLLVLVAPDHDWLPT